MEGAHPATATRRISGRRPTSTGSRGRLAHLPAQIRRPRQPPSSTRRCAGRPGRAVAVVSAELLVEEAELAADADEEREEGADDGPRDEVVGPRGQRARPEADARGVLDARLEEVAVGARTATAHVVFHFFETLFRECCCAFLQGER